MENLYKLAEHLLEEADRLAMAALHSRSPHQFHEVLKLCDKSHGICEVLEVWESMGDKHEYMREHDHDNPYPHNPDNPRRRRRR